MLANTDCHKGVGHGLHKIIYIYMKNKICIYIKTNF